MNPIARLLVLGFVFSTHTLFAADSSAKTKVLVITGGHGFEQEPFFKMFRENSNITFTAAEHAKNNATAWESPEVSTSEVIVLYDMPTNITDAQKARFLALFDRGAGLVVLHHALVSFQDWPDYEHIIGGRYPKPPKGQPQVTDKIGYQHDVDFQIVVTDKQHPITKGLKDFSIHDEIYWGFRVGVDVHPLLTTTHEKSGKPLMWTRTEKKSRVVYLQLGHDHSAYENTDYRVLISRAIDWAAPKTNWKN